jgi:hypothetical protein
MTRPAVPPPPAPPSVARLVYGLLVLVFVLSCSGFITGCLAQGWR